MRVLYVITGLGVGGAERQVVDLANGMHKRGFDVAICYLTGSIDVAPNAEIPCYGLGMTGHPLGVFAAMRKLRRIVRAFQPDVIHSHMVHANLLSRLLRLTLSVPRLICTAHNTNEGGRLRMAAYRLTDTLADLSTNVSREAVEAFVKMKAAPAHRMVAIHNGIDVEAFTVRPEKIAPLRQSLGLNAADRVLLAVGRLAPSKDYPNLLQAFAAVQADAPDLRLLIAGEGELRPQIEQLIHTLGLGANVTLLGIRRDVADLYALADVYVMSSAWEGFGLVVAEAMAAHRVVVATDCGGVKEVLGGCGFLIPAQDSSALARGIRSALGLTQAQAEEMGRKARRHVERHYSLDTVLDKWQQVYQGKALAS